MTDRQKKVATIWAVPAVSVLGIASMIIAADLAPWDMMSRQEAREADQALMDRLDRHEQRMSDKIDRLAETVAKVVGTVETFRATEKIQ